MRTEGDPSTVDETSISHKVDLANAGQGADGGTTFAAERDPDDDTLRSDNASIPSPQEKPANAIEYPTTTTPIAQNNPEHSATFAPMAAPPPTKSPEDSRTKLETFLIMLSLCTAVFLAALDTSIITTALPTISEYFGSDAGYTWIGSAYLLANAASTPSWGKFADIWGRKPILLTANVIFWIGSLLAGVSVNVTMLIAARAIQGIGGGGLIVLSNICISDLFSMRNRGKYFGMIGMVWAFASAIGPLLGGVFTEFVTWRWCFYINLPISGAGFFVLLFFLKLDNPRTPVWQGLKAVDWLGSLFIVGGTLMFLLGLEFGGVVFPWQSATVICLIIFGVVSTGLFITWEKYGAKYPLMPLHLFHSISTVAAFGVCFFHGFVFIAGSYYLPLYFQAVLGASPLLSGVYLLPFALSLSFLSGATGVFIKKTGKYIPPIIFGMVFMTLGFGLFIDLKDNANWAKIIIFQIIAGIGVGPNFQSPLIALQSHVPPRDIATATATFGFVRNLSTSISVVIGSVVFQNAMKSQGATLSAIVGPTLAEQLSGGAAGAEVSIVEALPTVQRDAVRYAYWYSLREMWIVYVVFAAVGILVSLCIRPKTLSKEHTLTKTGLLEEEAKRKERKAARRAARASTEMQKSDVEEAMPPAHESQEGKEIS